MFIKSFSQKSVESAVSITARLIIEFDKQLDKYPVNDLPSEKEIARKGVIDLLCFSREKRKKLEIKARFINGALMAVLEKKFDGSNKDFFRYAQKVFVKASRAGAPIGKATYKNFRRDAKDPHEKFFRKGYKWGESYYERK